MAETMTALVIDRFGGPEVLTCRRVDRPTPGPGQVLIRVAYCGVCRHDLLTRAGAFPRIALPVILGHQVSGTVAAVGAGVDGLARGQRVMTLIYAGCGGCAACRAGNAALCLEARPRFLGEDIDGGYAEYVVVDRDIVIQLPDDIPLAHAAIVTCTFGTAWHALATRGRVERGESVLITGASGGVGSHAIQVARELGARVIAVTTSPAKVPRLVASGADAVLVAEAGRFAAAAKRETGGRGVDVVLEVVGTPTLGETIHAVRNGGRIVVVGNVDGAPAELRPAHLILKEISLIGTKSCTRPEVETVLDLVRRGRLRIEVTDRLPLARGAELHRRMAAGDSQGRSVIEVAGG